MFVEIFLLAMLFFKPRGILPLGVEFDVRLRGVESMQCLKNRRLSGLVLPDYTSDVWLNNDRLRVEDVLEMIDAYLQQLHFTALHCSS
jgi:hypothetical protein